MDPLISLIAGSVLLAVLVFFFWPNKGFISRLNRDHKNNEKAMIENSLKHLYDCEYNSQSASLDSIAGNLHISGDLAAQVFNNLEAMNLAKVEKDHLVLTPDGRDYALKIIRIHRIWERYLADETSVEEAEWHEEAEHIEHKMTLKEADQLAARIGNPIVDPHGDPIPTSDGEIHKLSGNKLADVEEGSFCKILHLEDEPKAIYSQLAAIGLYVGMKIKVVEKNENRIKFVKDNEEAVLAPLFAQNVLVKIEEHQELPLEDSFPLSNLKMGEEATVVGISGACRGQQRRRLMDLGVLPGTKIYVEMKSPLGDPTAYQVRGTKIAIRKKQSELIYVKN